MPSTGIEAKNQNEMCLLGSDRSAIRRIVLFESFHAKCVITIKMMTDCFGPAERGVLRISGGCRT